MPLEKCRYCGKENHLSEETVCDSSPHLVIGHDLYFKDKQEESLKVNLKVDLSSELSDKIKEADELRERVRLLDAENKFLSSKISVTKFHEKSFVNDKEIEGKLKLLDKCVSTIMYIDSEAKRDSAVHRKTQAIIKRIKKERL